MRKLSMWIGSTIMMCAILFACGTDALAEETGWAEKLAQAEGVLSVETIKHLLRICHKTTTSFEIGRMI